MIEVEEIYGRSKFTYIVAPPMGWRRYMATEPDMPLCIHNMYTEWWDRQILKSELERSDVR